MKTYTLEVCGCTRSLPFIHINEHTAFASFVILGDSELIQAAAQELVKKLPDVDVILTAEAKGIALAYEISRLLEHKEFIVARKSVKSYMKNPLVQSVHSITTKGEQKLYLDELDAQKLSGKRVLIIDDVISTGESLRAIEQLAMQAQGDVVCKAAVLAEGDAAMRDDIVFLKKLPLFHIEEDGNYIEL